MKACLHWCLPLFVNQAFPSYPPWESLTRILPWGSDGRPQVKLSYDQFGNFVVQKLLETGDSQDHSDILQQVKGHAPRCSARNGRA